MLGTCCCIVLLCRNSPIIISFGIQLVLKPSGSLGIETSHTIADTSVFSISHDKIFMEQQRSTQSRSVDDYITVIGDYLSSLV